MSIAERISAIMECYLTRGVLTGQLGTVVKIDPQWGGGYRVCVLLTSEEIKSGRFKTAKDLTLIINASSLGWSASFKGFEARAGKLVDAAQQAVDAGSLRDVSRH